MLPTDINGLVMVLRLTNIPTADLLLNAVKVCMQSYSPGAGAPLSAGSCKTAAQGPQLVPAGTTAAAHTAGDRHSMHSDVLVWLCRTLPIEGLE